MTRTSDSELFYFRRQWFDYHGAIDREALMIQTGDRVRKVGGDYRFEGTVVSVFAKLSGVRRCVVEDDRGVLFIFNESQLELV